MGSVSVSSSSVDLGRFGVSVLSLGEAGRFNEGRGSGRKTLSSKLCDIIKQVVVPVRILL